MSKLLAKTKPEVQPADQPQSPQRRRLIKRALVTGSLTVGAGGTCYAAYHEGDDLQITQQDVHLAGWPAAAAGLRVGQISDFHCTSAHSRERIRRAVHMLMAQSPDVVLTGDYISQGHTVDWIDSCAASLAPLTAAPHGAFAILGNHDWKGHQQERIAATLAQNGMHVLRNQSLPMPGAPGVWLVGLDDRSAKAQNCGLALAGVPPDALKILLIHEPDYADEAPAGFALQFSGHSHGGQIRIPGLPALYTPEYGRRYPEGLQKAKNHLVYTSRGIGMTGPQGRLNCPPEVNLIRLFPQA